MRISLPLDPGPLGRPAIPNSVYYDAVDNVLVFHPHDVHTNHTSIRVDLDNFQFTLHEKCESPSFPNRPNYPVGGSSLEIGEVGSTGITLTPAQLVELIDEARNA